MKTENFKKLNMENFYFFNRPSYYSIEDYSDVLDKIKLKYFPNNVKAIYTSGSISTPGISDIDIIIVLKNRVKGLGRVLLNKKERYLICHPAYIVDKNILKDIRFIYPDLDLKLVKGSKISVNRIKKKLIDYALVFLSIDIVIRHFPSDYLEMLLHKRINVRDSLLRLNALNHSLMLYKKLTGKTMPDFRNYIKKVTLLRRDWFELNEKERNLRLLNLLGESVIISLSFIDKLREFILKKSIIKIDQCAENIVYTGMQNRAFFVNNWEAEKALKAMVKFYKHYKKLYSYLPVEFAALLIEYSKNNGILSEHIKKKIEIGSIKYKIKGKKVINKRISLLNKQADIAVKTKHSHFVAFFDYGFKSKYGFLNKFMYVGRRIKEAGFMNRLHHIREGLIYV